MYRNITYNNKTGTITLFTWDDTGKRISAETSYEPYIYLEDPRGTHTTLFNSKAKKKSFASNYLRSKFIKESSIRRIYENLQCNQQFLVDSFWKTNESDDFAKHPLKTFYIDIETYSPQSEGFPDTNNPTHPIIAVTCYDTLSEKYYVFGTNAFDTKESNIIYNRCKDEKDLFRKLVSLFEEDYPDILSGWNCLEENQHIWLEDRIVKIKDLSNNFKNKPLKKHGISINNFVNTGIKEEFLIENEHGSKILCSEDHKFMMYRKKKDSYKNYNTLTKELVEISIKDIIKQQEDYDFYTINHLATNNNKNISYKDLIETFDNLREFIVEEDDIKYTVNLTNKRRRCDNFDIIKNESISTQIIQLIGFIFTDGSYDKKDKVYRITSKYGDLMSMYANIFATEHKKNIKPFTECKTTFNNRDFISYSKQFGINNKIGLLHHIIYDHNNTKKPNIEFLSRLSHDQFKAFFSGMMDGDGWIETNSINICNYDCKKYNFLEDLQELLLWNGVQSRVHNNYISINCNEINKDFICSLNIKHPKRSDSLLRCRYKTIKNTPSKNIQWMYSGTDEYIVRILPVKKTGRYVQMYDITTETHTFLCKGIHTHNCEGFDIPYIINRSNLIMGEDFTLRFSPIKNIYTREVTGRFGKTFNRYYIDGISCIDYLEIYRKFCFTLRQSYRLDSIAEIELGENKIDYGNISLAELADTDWTKFIEYNIHDVRLLVRLEEKLQYIALLRMLAYVGLTTYEAALGSISLLTGALAIKARKRGVLMPTFIRSSNNTKNPGAYVSDPIRGFQKNIVTFDAASLYPSVMMTLNMSPETKVGNIWKEGEDFMIKHISGKTFKMAKDNLVNFINTEKCAISKAGILFSQKRRGIVPEFLDEYFKKRVEVKKNIKKLERKIYNNPDISQAEKDDIKDEISRLYTKQLVIKILINSLYGAFGNKHASFGDDDIASSVTLTGQAVIKQSNNIIREFIKNDIPDLTDQEVKDLIIYNDTDSCFVSMDAYVKRKFLETDKMYVKLNELEHHLNKKINEWACVNLKSIDSRFDFKREKICDAGLFLAKKRYVVRIIDNEGTKTDKFKYTGVDIVRSTYPNKIKEYGKKLTETMILSQSRKETDKILNDVYKDFKQLSFDDISFVRGIQGYEKYCRGNSGLNVKKGTPIHVKASYYYNTINKELGINNKYENIVSGDKVRFVYVNPRNKYKISVIAYKNEIPEEYNQIFTIDYEKMFEKILFSSIESYYEAVKWTIRKPSNNVVTDLFDLFGND